MATYSTVKGFAIQSLASDPVTSVAAAGTWASSPALNTARKNPGGIGLAAAAVCVAGQPDSPTVTDAVEEYNGSSWSTVTAIPVAQCFMASGGILTAGWVTAGNDDGGGSAPFPLTMNLYDGTNWTTGNPILTGRYAATGSGPTTSAFIAGGAIPPGSPGGVTTTEKYNGTSWTASGALNTGRYSGMSSGTATAGLIAGGHSSGSLIVKAEKFDGSTWTETGDLNMARQRGAVGGGTATSTSSLVAGGYQDSVPPLYYTANTEFFDGTTWTEVANLGAAVAGQGFATSGSTSALSFGGDNPPTSEKTTSEVWTVPSTVSIAQEGQVWFNSASNVLKGYKAILGTGAWAAGGAMNTGRFPLGSATNAPAHSTALGFGGTAPGGKTGATESYDGTTWTEKGDLQDPRIALGGAGTATAALAFGGDSPGYPTATESFNGTSWTVVPATLTEGKDSAAGFGLQTAAIYAGGYVGPPGNTVNVQSYNGTSWSEVFNINTVRSYVYGCGTQTSGIIAGGSSPPYSAAAETWNGTCWTTINSLNTARANFAMFGIQTNAVGSGGDDGSTPRFTKCEQYDGTSWTEVADLANANKMSASSGTGGSAGLNFGGSDTSNNPMTRTEAWTVPASTLAVKTFTSS